jgi:hypothetical protein
LKFQLKKKKKKKFKERKKEKSDKENRENILEYSMVFLKNKIK